VGVTSSVDRPPGSDTAVVRLRQEALEWRAVDGEVVALDLESAVYLGANDTGALLWEKLASGSTIEELSRCLVEAYGIAPEGADADVRAFLSAMAAHGLLTT
jgi:hypothetical protein